MNTRVIQYLTGIALSTYIAAYYLDDEKIGNDLDDEIHGRSVSRNSKNPSPSDSSVGNSAAAKASLRLDMDMDKSLAPGNKNQAKSESKETMVSYSAPSWEPIYPFSFPIEQLTVKKTFESFSNTGIFGNLLYLASGSNSDVYLGTNEDSKLVVKMLKADKRNRVSSNELNVEHGMLARLSHESIIDLIGVGDKPEKFLVLEFLGGGTLQQLLHPETKSTPGLNLSFTTMFAKKKTVIPLGDAISFARVIASVLDYLHERCHPDACLIHRGFK